MTKKQILIFTGLGVVILLTAAAGTLVVLSSINKNDQQNNAINTSKTPSEELSPVDQLKKAESNRTEAMTKQQQGSHGEAIQLLEGAKTIYSKQKDATKVSEAEAEIAAYKDIQKHAPKPVTGVSKASGGE